MSPATRLRLLAATAGALLLPALVAPVLAAEAPAGPSARIAALRADGPQLRFVLAVRGLTSGDALDAASLRVAAAGRTLSARAVTEDAAAVGDSSLLPRREAMLVVDTSGSMRGRRLAAAQAAALSYSAALPADVRLGLTTFAARPVLRLAPTTDRSALASAVSRLTASGGTALYDGVVSAVGGFGTRGQAGAKGAGGATTERRMLVLSDGADTASRRALTGATTLLRSSGSGWTPSAWAVTPRSAAPCGRSPGPGRGVCCRSPAWTVSTWPSCGRPRPSVSGWWWWPTCPTTSGDVTCR